MPVKAVKQGNQWRVVEPDGNIARAKNKDGSPGKARDGGGYYSKKNAEKLVGAINSNL